MTTDALLQAMRIARRAVITDLESECIAMDMDGQRWLDTRPMVDPREHSDEVIDMARECIDFALETRIAVRHPSLHHLLRIAAN